MTGRLTREQKKAQTRERLLSAAREVFAERGFYFASVDEIAERAGYSMGAVYSNFESKADLFLALFEEHIAAQMHDYLDLFAGAATKEEKIRSAADRWMRYLRENPDYFPLFLEFAAFAARDQALLDALSSRLHAFHEAFGEMVRAGAAQRGFELPPDAARQMGVAINSLATGLALAKLADPDSVPDELFGSVLARLLGGGTAS